MGQTNRRTKKVVDPKQQRQLILAMSVTPGLALAAMLGFVCYFCLGLYEEALTLSTPLQNLTPVYLSVGGLIVVAGLVILANALLVSHRVAGPAYRIRKSIEQIRAGDIAFRVKLREKDHLTDLADELNGLLDDLNATPNREFYTRAMKAAEQQGQDESLTVDDVEAPVAATSTTTAEA